MNYWKSSNGNESSFLSFNNTISSASTFQTAQENQLEFDDKENFLSDWDTSSEDLDKPTTTKMHATSLGKSVKSFAEKRQIFSPAGEPFDVVKKNTKKFSFEKKQEFQNDLNLGISEITKKTNQLKLTAKLKTHPILKSVPKKVNETLKPSPSDSKESIKEETSVKKKAAFICNICKCEFNLKSLFIGHKRSHQEVTKTPKTPALLKKASSNVSISSASSSRSTAGNKCKYCDKKFALRRTLHIHLSEKCLKIPAMDRKKLHFHEMDHVKKAPLPHFDFIHKTDSKTQNQAATPGKFGNPTSTKKLYSTQTVKKDAKGSSKPYSGLYQSSPKKLFRRPCIEPIDIKDIRNILETTERKLAYTPSQSTSP